jgi:hypothetical protein
MFMQKTMINFWGLSDHGRVVYLRIFDGNAAGMAILFLKALNFSGASVLMLV